MISYRTKPSQQLYHKGVAQSCDSLHGWGERCVTCFVYRGMATCDVISCVCETSRHTRTRWIAFFMFLLFTTYHTKCHLVENSIRGAEKFYFFIFMSNNSSYSISPGPNAERHKAALSTVSPRKPCRRTSGVTGELQCKTSKASGI